YYEVGFLICTTVGVLVLVLTPVIGACFCVCRCCENCGGEMHQRQRKNADCQRGFYTASLVATSVLIIVGVAIAYAANHNMSMHVKSTRRFINTNIRDLKTLANNTPSQVDYLTGQYATAKNKVLSELDNIGPLLGGRIHSQLQKEVVPSLDSALRLAGAKIENAIKAMRETKEALENVSSSLEVLQEGTGKLRASLSDERASLSNTLSDPACTNGAVSHTCTSVRATLAQLGTSADFSRVKTDRSVGDLTEAVSKKLRRLVFPSLRTSTRPWPTSTSSWAPTSATSCRRSACVRPPPSSSSSSSSSVAFFLTHNRLFFQGYSSFNDTPRLVKEQTRNIVSGVKSMLDKIGTEINGFAKMFPVESSLANFSVFLTQQQKTVESYYPQLDQMDFYRWIGCVGTLCMVVLVLAFNLLGLLCGTCGYDKQATPTTRGCLSNTGGNLLMAGVGFSFVFSWVLMGIVTTLFVVGGNVEKLLCEPLANRQLFKIIDTPFLVHPAKKNFLPGMLFQNPNIDLTLGGMYRECYENNGLYHALQLETMFNINAFLNRTVYNKDLAKVLEGVQVDLQGISLLEQAGRDALINFANSGIGYVDYESYLAELNKGVTLVDLLTFSADLEAQADQLPRGALENALKGHASSIRQIHREQVVPLEQAMSTLSQSIKQLQRTSNDLPVKVTNILSAIDAAEYLIAHNASHVVKQETKGYMQSLVGYFRQYTQWVQNSLAGEVAPCKPLSNMVDSMEIVACSFIIDSVVKLRGGGRGIWGGVGETRRMDLMGKVFVLLLFSRTPSGSAWGAAPSFSSPVSSSPSNWPSTTGGWTRRTSLRSESRSHTRALFSFLKLNRTNGSFVLPSAIIHIPGLRFSSFLALSSTSYPWLVAL
ncbi:unnamed protein product, partial [Tetraodon nigroviridis]